MRYFLTYEKWTAVKAMIEVLKENDETKLYVQDTSRPSDIEIYPKFIVIERLEHLLQDGHYSVSDKELMNKIRTTLYYRIIDKMKELK